MQLYIYADHEDLSEIEPALSTAIAEWVGKDSENPVFVNRQVETDSGSGEWNIGIQLKVEKKTELKDPLSFLYSLARQHKCEFVIGISENGSDEDVCYFGYEEGKPDVFEVANYLGL